MYIVTEVNFNWSKIIFENSKGKLFEIECSNDFAEKFLTRYSNFKNPNQPTKYKVKVSYIDSEEIFLFKKKFSLLKLYWLKFRGYLSLTIELV